LTEYFPLITRWELEKNNWVNVRFPLNAGSTRDIPPDAVFHESLVYRLENDQKYVPPNNHGGNTGPCLRHRKASDGKFVLPELKYHEGDEDHKTFKFSNPAVVG